MGAGCSTNKDAITAKPKSESAGKDGWTNFEWKESSSTVTVCTALVESI